MQLCAELRGAESREHSPTAIIRVLTVGRESVRTGSAVPEVRGKANRRRVPGSGRRPLLIPLLLVALLGACGAQARSVAAVCHVWNTQGLALRQRYHDDVSGAHLLRSLADVVTAPSALASLTSNMAAAAPPSAEPSFTTVSKTIAAEKADEPGVVTDPELLLAKTLLRSFEARDAFQQVDNFLTNHCTESPGA